MTATAVFGALGISVDVTGFPQPVALETLRRGEISALVSLTPEPARLFRDIRPDEGLHFLSIGTGSNLPQSYSRTNLTAQDLSRADRGERARHHHCGGNRSRRL